MEQVIPWPVSLGIAGGAIAILVSFLYWMLRKLANGDWVPRIQVEAMIGLEKKRADELIAAAELAATNRVGDAVQRADEWKETADVEREARSVQTGIAQKAVDGLTTFDHFLGAFVPKLGNREQNSLEGGATPHGE